MIYCMIFVIIICLLFVMFKHPFIHHYNNAAEMFFQSALVVIGIGFLCMTHDNFKFFDFLSYFWFKNPWQYGFLCMYVYVTGTLSWIFSKKFARIFYGIFQEFFMHEKFKNCKILGKFLENFSKNSPKILAKFKNSWKILKIRRFLKNSQQNSKVLAKNGIFCTFWFKILRIMCTFCRFLVEIMCTFCCIDKD